MKIFIALLSMISLTVVAQPGVDNPWMNQLTIDNQGDLTYYDIKQAGERYWNNHDKNKKGSGYKPFMRWLDNAKSYVKTDGTLQSASDLKRIVDSLDSYKSMTTMSSNWNPLGPFTTLGTGSWSTGQGRVNTMIVDPNNPNTYYLGSPSGGIWKSTDAGVNWLPISDFLLQIGVSAIAIDPNDSNTIYIGTGDDDARDTYSVGLLKSIDGGATWNPTGLSFASSFANISEVYLDPRDANTIIVSSNNGFYRSTDAGATFTRTLIGNVKDVKFKPSAPDTIYLATNNSFYISTNNGVTFTQLSTGLPTGIGRMVIAVTPANTNYVYLLITDTNYGLLGLYRSNNSGSSFTRRDNNVDILESPQAWFDLALEVSPTNADLVYTGCLNVWRSTNGGSIFTKLNSWSSPNSSSYTHADIHQLRQFGTELFALTDGGIYRSTDSGNTFTDLTAQAQIGQFYRIALGKQSSSDIIGGLQDNGGQTTSGVQWKNYYGADGMDGGIDPLNPNIRYGFVQFGGSLFFTNDAGNSRQAAINAPAGESGNWITPLVVNSQGVIYAGYSRLYQVQNGAFVPVSNTFADNIDHIEIDPQDDAVIYLAVNSQLYRSDNAGVSFSLLFNFNNDISAIEVSNTDNNTVYVATVFSFGEVFKSINRGSTFTNITNNLPDLGKNTLASMPMSVDGDLYVGTTVGVYKYDDVTTQWTTYNSNLPNVNIRDLEIHEIDQTLTAGTYGRGVWQSPVTTNLPPVDIKIEQVNNANGGDIICGNTTDLDIVLSNVGTMPITSFDIAYTINSGAIVNQNYTQNIAPQSQTTITLSAINLVTGVNNINISVDTNNDAFNSNNSDNITVYKNNLAAVNDIYQFENRDLLTYNQLIGANQWQRGTPSAPLLNQSVSGTQVYATNLTGDYAPSTTAYLYSGCYDLTNINNPTLQFDMAYDLETNFDVLYMQYSTDAGVTWSVLGNASDPNWYNSNTPAVNCDNCVGAQWTGTDFTFNNYSYDLSTLNTNNVLFRFVFKSDFTVQQEGVVIDNLVVTGVLNNNDQLIQHTYQLYPNPSNGVYNLEWTSNESFDYQVHDVFGKLITSQSDNIGNNHTIDLSGLSNGMYFITLSTATQTITEKLLLQ